MKIMHFYNYFVPKQAGSRPFVNGHLSGNWTEDVPLRWQRMQRIAEDGKLTLRGLYYVEATGKSVIETEFIYLAKENLLQKDLSDSIDPTGLYRSQKSCF